MVGPSVRHPNTPWAGAAWAAWAACGRSVRPSVGRSVGRSVVGRSVGPSIQHTVGSVWGRSVRPSVVTTHRGQVQRVVQHRGSLVMSRQVEVRVLRDVDGRCVRRRRAQQQGELVGALGQLVGRRDVQLAGVALQANTAWVCGEAGRQGCMVRWGGGGRGEGGGEMGGAFSSLFLYKYWRCCRTCTAAPPQKCPDARTGAAIVPPLRCHSMIASPTYSPPFTR